MLSARLSLRSQQAADRRLNSHCRVKVATRPLVRVGPGSFKTRLRTRVDRGERFRVAAAMISSRPTVTPASRAASLLSIRLLDHFQGEQVVAGGVRQTTAADAVGR